MGGFDYLIANLLREEIESHLGRKIIKKIEKRLFEKYGITITQSMNDFAKFEDILKEIFGGGSRGMVRSILNNLCSFKKNSGRSDSLVTLHDSRITEMVLDMLGDRDYRIILDMLIGKSLVPYEILKKTNIPQASAYRKIDALVQAGLLVEDGKVLSSETGRPAVKLTTLYRGLDMSIVKNQVTAQVKLSQNMLAKSTILYTLYSV